MSRALRPFASTAAVSALRSSSCKAGTLTSKICSSLLVPTSTLQSYYSTTNISLSDNKHNDPSSSIQSMRTAREARLAAKAQKQAELDEYIQKSLEQQQQQQQQTSNTNADIIKESEKENKEKEAQTKRDQIRKELLSEAGIMTRSLYRTCLRCIKTIRPGNDADEAEFVAREAAQKKELEEMDLASLDVSTSVSYSPPVDRENELNSRADYYHKWTRENFDQESDCLDVDPWLEEHVERYLHFIRGGEEKRRWILNDYKFDDPYPDTFDYERVDHFEKRARDLLKDIYDAKGWNLGSNAELSGEEDDDDDFFSDDEDEERP